MRMDDSGESYAPFRLDEGFSETQDDHGRAMYEATAASFSAWLNTQSEETRAQIALEVLRTLKTSTLSGVVDKLTPLLHLDPIERLPIEIVSEIFTYLDASTLLTASLASQTWRERILDPRLWQELYKSQGWGVDIREVRAFEEEHANTVRSEFQKARGQLRGSLSKGQPQPKRRATSDWLDSTTRRVSADVSQWREQHGIPEADTDVIENSDHEMKDVSSSVQDSPSRPNKRQSHDSGDEMDYQGEPSQSARQGSIVSDSTVTAKPRMLVDDGTGYLKLNWPYVYKQRHRLEENWLKGNYTNFQLPHPSYPYEAHTECVYTIQFHGKWLVSGSRDKTLRVWDLETRRLRGKPLTGHSQSVLCLQFDPTEEEDVIISGSSDSSVIVWKFSTGQKLFNIPSAHEESVLNLRFDRRYLVTCSKDKKIKIWSRHTLMPLDPDYPKVTPQSNARLPSHIIDVTSMEPSLLETRLANGTIKPLKAYSHLLTLEGHGAAVNAIQINGDLIVSASGDRLIRVWNVKTGMCLRVLPGHQKGIACVQFDSKRIVSGSSDNTVRIYDPMTGAEVAVLLGHTNLVRTVQAGFGDIPGGDEDDLERAREAEREYIEGLENGTIVEDRQYLRRMRHGEITTSRTALGANLPPGGGGSKWGRIVSGSYDETIIVWTKDANGHWVVGQTLRQEAAVKASIEADRLAEQANHVRRQGERTVRRHSGIVPSNGNLGIVEDNSLASTSRRVQQAFNDSVAGLQTSLQNIMGRSRGSNTNSGSRSRPIVQPTVDEAMAHMDGVVPNAVQQAVTDGAHDPNSNASYHRQSTRRLSSAGSSNNQSQVQSPPPEQVTANSSTTHNHLPSTPQTMLAPTIPPPPPPAIGPTPSAAASSAAATAGSTTTQISTATTQTNAGPGQTSSTTTTQTITAPTTQSQPQPPQQPQTQFLGQLPRNPAQHQQQHGSVSRVFKLQFDARRIVCCSQDSRIIGWDFANNDQEIMDCAKFFHGP